MADNGISLAAQRTPFETPLPYTASATVMYDQCDCENAVDATVLSPLALPSTRFGKTLEADEYSVEQTGPITK